MRLKMNIAWFSDQGLGAGACVRKPYIKEKLVCPTQINNKERRL